MFIDLDPNELKKVSINIEGYDDALNNDYFPNALQYVSNLVANSDGIKTEEVANLLRSIYDKLIFYSDSIKSNLNGLEEQIAESLEAYSISTEDAREKLAQLFLVMQEFTSSGKMDLSIVSSDGYMEEKDTVETLDDSQESSTQDGENVEIDAVTGAAPEATDVNENLYNDMLDYVGRGRAEDLYREDYTDSWSFNAGTIDSKGMSLINEYVDTSIDNLKGELDPMIDQFNKDFNSYVYEQSDTLHTGNYDINITPEQFLNSEAGSKYAQYLANDMGTSGKDYLNIVNNPDAAFSDYLSEMKSGNLYGNTSKNYYNNLHDGMYDVLFSEVENHNK